MNRARIALALVFWSAASMAQAQDAGSSPPVSLTPADASRWDVTGQFTWLGERRPHEAFFSSGWFKVVSGTGSVGYYWTPHLKAELDVSASGEGESYSIEQIAIPGSNSSLYLQREHRVRLTTLSAGLHRQFFENTWFHPFIGGGIELLREREVIETPIPRAPVPVQAPETERRLRYDVRPFVLAGFKAYVSERTFIRADFRTAWNTDGLAGRAWRTGVGLDF